MAGSKVNKTFNIKRKISYHGFPKCFFKEDFMNIVTQTVVTTLMSGGAGAIGAHFTKVPYKVGGFLGIGSGLITSLSSQMLTDNEKRWQRYAIAIIVNFGVLFTARNLSPQMLQKYGRAFQIIRALPLFNPISIASFVGQASSFLFFNSKISYDSLANMSKQDFTSLHANLKKHPEILEKQPYCIQLIIQKKTLSEGLDPISFLSALTPKQIKQLNRSDAFTLLKNYTAENRTNLSLIEKGTSAKKALLSLWITNRIGSIEEYSKIFSFNLIIECLKDHNFDYDANTIFAMPTESKHFFYDLFCSKLFQNTILPNFSLPKQMVWKKMFSLLYTTTPSFALIFDSKNLNANKSDTLTWIDKAPFKDVQDLYKKIIKKKQWLSLSSDIQSKIKLRLTLEGNEDTTDIPISPTTSQGIQNLSVYKLSRFHAQFVTNPMQFLKLFEINKTLVFLEKFYENNLMLLKADIDSSILNNPGFIDVLHEIYQECPKWLNTRFKTVEVKEILMKLATKPLSLPLSFNLKNLPLWFDTIKDPIEKVSNAPFHLQDTHRYDTYFFHSLPLNTKKDLLKGLYKMGYPMLSLPIPLFEDQNLQDFGLQMPTCDMHVSLLDTKPQEFFYQFFFANLHIWLNLPKEVQDQFNTQLDTHFNKFLPTIDTLNALSSQKGMDMIKNPLNRLYLAFCENPSLFTKLNPPVKQLFLQHYKRNNLNLTPFTEVDDQ